MTSQYICARDVVATVFAFSNIGLQIMRSMNLDIFHMQRHEVKKCFHGIKSLCVLSIPDVSHRRISWSKKSCAQVC